MENKLTKIYTKTGDKGSTSLLGGTRVPKYHIRIEAYGNADELCSYIGLIRDFSNNQAIKDDLLIVQEKLFVLQALLSCEDKSFYEKLPQLTNSDVSWLESKIDKMNESLPELKYFVLPGGNAANSFSHVARCICRRTERIVIQLSEQYPIEENLYIYLNRLSDYLFVLARYIALDNKIDEIKWKPK